MPAKAQCEGDTGRENAVFTVRDDGPARVDCRRVAVECSTADEVAGWHLQQRLEGNIDTARDVPRTRVTGVSRERLPRQPAHEGCFGVVVHGNLNAHPGSTVEDAANISGSGPPPVALAQSKLARQAGFRVSALFRMPRLAPPREPAVEQGHPVESGCTQNPPHSCCPLTEGRVIDDDR